MRAEEIRELSTDDIKARVAELREERFRLRFRSATEPLDNPLRMRTIRRDIARLLTILTEKERGVAGAGAGAGGAGEGSGTGTGKEKRRTRAGRAGKRQTKRVKNG